MSEDAESGLLPPLVRLLRPRWIPLLLMGAATATLAHSLGQAEWVSGYGRHEIGLWLGLLCGAALAASRFRGRAALGYSLTLAVTAAGQMAGRVVPPHWASLAFADLVWAAHLRLLTLLYRIAGWGAAILEGETINDAGLFVFLVVLITWNASAWLAWCVIRRRRALDGLLPSGVLLALNVHLADQPVIPLALFVGCAVLLTAYAEFKRQHADWERRRVDYPDWLGGAWGGSAAVLALMIALLAGASPLVGAPQGWQALAELVRLSRFRAADAAGRVFADVNPPRSDEPLVTALTPNLASIGAPLPQGRDTIMWVLVSDPLPPPPEAQIYAPSPPQHYWRSLIFAAYTGKGWEPAPDAPTSLVPAVPADAPPGRYALKQHYEIVAPHGEALFAVNAPVWASEGAALHLTLPDASASLAGSISVYDVTSWAASASREQLMAASTVYPAEISSTYLQLPPDLPQRVRGLAARVTAGAATPYDRAVRLQTYLRTTYPYRLDAPPPPPGRDAVDYFLFEAPGGFCSYYASAMAVMLRAQGVPARVVAGYAMGEFDYGRGAYRVPADASHAWVEVYFPEYGWVEFEPTAARSPFEYRRDSPPVPAATDLPSPQPANPPDAPRAAAWVAGLAGLLALAIAAWRLSRSRARGARALYWSLRRALAWAGLTSPPSATPDEFISAHYPALAPHPRLRAALTRATALYLLAAFSPRPPVEAETRAVRRLWSRARAEWLKLLVLRRLR